MDLQTTFVTEYTSGIGKLMGIHDTRYDPTAMGYRAENDNQSTKNRQNQLPPNKKALENQGNQQLKINQ